MSSLIYYYPVDLTGRSPTNHVNREAQLLVNHAGLDVRVIGLDHGGFYTRDLSVWDADGNPLRPYTDYVATFTYEDVTHRTGLEVCGALVFLNPALTGVVYVSAQMVGGDVAFTLDARETTVQHLIAQAGEPIEWAGLVGVARQYGPGELQAELWEKVSYTAVNTELENLAATIKGGDQVRLMQYRTEAKQQHQTYLAGFGTQVEDHTSDFSDPHFVSKAQVGLGQVSNYPLAVPNPDTGGSSGTGDGGDTGGEVGLPTSTPPAEWEVLSYAIPQSSYGYAVAYHGGLFVAVGSGGVIATSTDGQDWLMRAADVAIGRPLNAVAYGNGLWVAVGDDNTLATSPDGIAWTHHPDGFDTTELKRGTAIAYLGDRWVLAGENYIYWSTDGLVWTRSNQGSADAVYTTFSYGDGVWLVGGKATAVLTSTDAVTWGNASTVFGLGALDAVEAIAYGNGAFVAVGRVNTAGSDVYKTATSSDGGITWTETSSDGPFTDLAFGAGHFVALSDTHTVVISTDGVTWTPATGNFGSVWMPLHGLGFGGDRWLVVGENGMVLRSVVTVTYEAAPVVGPAPTGDRWISLPSYTFSNIVGDVAYGSGRWIAAISNGDIASSPDGLTWETVSGASGPAINNVIYTGEQFVGVGSFGSVRTSPDGVIWTEGSNAIDGLSDHALVVRYAQGVYVAIIGRYIYTSTDAVTWTRRYTAATDDLFYTYRVLEYGNGRWVVGGGGDLPFVTSTDGITWTETPAPFNWTTGNSYTGMAYGNGLWVIGGSGTDSANNTTAWLCGVSTDGITWDILELDTPVNDIAFGAGYFAAGGVMYSTDGRVWTDVVMPSDYPGAMSLSYAGGKWFTGGSNLSISVATVLDDPEGTPTPTEPDTGDGGTLPPVTTPLPDVNNTTYMTPYTTRRAIVNHALEPLAAHTARQDNPHGVTASQVGVYRKVQVDDISYTKLGVNDTAIDATTIQLNANLRQTYAQFHGHIRNLIPAGNFTSGVFNQARVGLGGGNAGKVMRGDGWWASIQSLVNAYSPQGGASVYYIDIMGNDAQAMQHINSTYSDLNRYPVGTIVLYRTANHQRFYNGEYYSNLVIFQQLRGAVRQSGGWTNYGGPPSGSMAHGVPI